MEQQDGTEVLDSGSEMPSADGETSSIEAGDVGEQPVSDETAEQSEQQETPENIDWDNTDPNKLPPEVQKYYKGMQASYTRKMQALASALEGLKTQASRLQLLDRAIAGDPEARAQLAGLIQVQQAQAQAQAHDVGDDIPAEFTDTKHLVSFFDNRLKTALAHAFNHIQGMISQHVSPLQQNFYIQQRLAEYNALKTKYPDFDNYVEQMVKIKEQNPGISLEAAYKLATYKPPVPPSKLVSKPGARPSAIRPKDSDRNLTFEEAAEAAIRQLKKGR